MEIADLANLAQPPHLRTLFANDPTRAERYVFRVADLRVDVSKQRITDDLIGSLIELAQSVGVEQRRDAMFAGEHINISEDRAVGHTALRLPPESSFEIDGLNVVPNVHAVLDAMEAFADRVRADDRITHVINIGIGGSDLGPAMAYQALDAFRR